MRRVAVVTALTLLLAGCGNTAPGPDGPAREARATAGAVESADRVRAAVETMSKTSFAYHHTAAGAEYDGVVHRPSDSTTLRLSTDSGLNEVVLIGGRGWARTNIDPTGSGAATEELSPWSELVPDTLGKPPYSYVNGAEALVGAELFSSVSGLHETAPRTYAGTIDLTANLDLNATNGASAPDPVDRARAVPMTVTLDEDGHITGVTIDVPGAPTRSEFTDFDAVAAPTPPTS